MNTQEPSIFFIYEQQKAVIKSQNLSSEEYQAKLKALAKKLGI